MIDVTIIPVLMRRGGRRYSPTWQGALLNRLLVTWRCGHAHESKFAALLCAEHEAAKRGLPLPIGVSD